MIKNKLLYILLLAGLGLFYILFVDKVALIILILALIFPFIQFFTLQAVSSGTSLSLQTDSETCTRNQESRINITISNKSVFPVSCALITADIENMMTGEKQELTTMFPVSARNQQSIKFSVTYNHCGKVKISLKKIKIYDYVKLFSKNKTVDLSKEITVIPEMAEINPEIVSAPVNFSDDCEYSKDKSGDDCSEIFNIRKYAYGDKINRIHWKLSSKTDELMIKEYSLTVSSQILIIFDCPADTSSSDAFSKIDAAIDSLMSLSVFLIRNDINHKIYWFSKSSSAPRTNNIYSEDDFYSFLNELYLSSVYTNDSMAFLEYCSQNTIRSSSHLIYISSVYSDETLHNFSVISHAHRKTYLYISENKKENEDGVLITDEFSSFSLNISNISENLSKIII